MEVNGIWFDLIGPGFDGQIYAVNHELGLFAEASNYTDLQKICVEKTKVPYSCPRESEIKCKY